LRQLETAAVWKPDVENDDIGMEVVGQSGRRLDRTGFSHDVELRIAFEGTPQALPDELVVIDQ
jgi:hypothetical protein